MSSIRFLLFEIKRVLVYSSTIFHLNDLIVFSILVHSKCMCQMLLRSRAKNYVLLVKLCPKVPSFWNIDRTVKSTRIVNISALPQSLYGGSLKTTFTVPLTVYFVLVLDLHTRSRMESWKKSSRTTHLLSGEMDNRGNMFKFTFVFLSWI